MAPSRCWTSGSPKRWDVTAPRAAGRRRELAHDHLAGDDAGRMILGTAAYMAPEQARGRAADKRADIWAFGCVLFEMLTGKRAFPGEDVTDTLAAVVKSVSGMARARDRRPAAGPPGAAVHACRRIDGNESATLRRFGWPSMARSRPIRRSPRPRLRRLAARPGRRSRPRLWLAASSPVWRRGCFVLAPATPAVSRFTIDRVDGVPIQAPTGQVTTMAFSPDGTKIAYRIATEPDEQGCPNRRETSRRARRDPDLRRDGKHRPSSRPTASGWVFS